MKVRWVWLKLEVVVEFLGLMEVEKWRGGVGEGMAGLGTAGGGGGEGGGGGGKWVREWVEDEGDEAWFPSFVFWISLKMNGDEV